MSRSIVIRNARIMTMEGPMIERGAVRIAEGRLIEVSSRTEPDHDNDEDALVIEADGRLLTPGLIDPHTHLGIDEEGVGWEGDDYNETSEPVTPHLRALDGIYSFDRGFAEAAEAGITTVQVLPGSANVIGGLMCCLKVLPGALLEEMLMLHPSGLKMALGENPKKYHGAAAGRAPLTRMGIAGLIREQFVKAAIYMQEREAAGAAQAGRDLRMEALVLALQRRIPVRVHAHRADDIETAVRIGKEFGLDLTVEHATEGRRLAHLLAKNGVDCCIGPTLSSRSKVELREMGWETYAALHEAGVRISFTTDHPVLPIQYLPMSAGLAVRAGLSAEAAWRGLTLNAARHLRLSERTGSLKPGKDADLVLWDGDPVTEGGQAELTIAGGRITFDSSK
ncbi:hypothetical protein VN24_06225 [Paenibacillus beijingensis]|uniref:Amidohydrolase-related domain-containing protein n=2 Tax=Paenibacillus beijingensis TaxID=1126833 RepID=A0A0D5NQK0_9BACL|nr:hypothetical protein VN24_06225 [Paenibacillus beijingensis]